MSVSTTKTLIIQNSDLGLVVEDISSELLSSLSSRRWTGSCGSRSVPVQEIQAPEAFACVHLMKIQTILTRRLSWYLFRMLVSSTISVLGEKGISLVRHPL